MPAGLTNGFDSKMKNPGNKHNLTSVKRTAIVNTRISCCAVIVTLNTFPGGFNWAALFLGNINTGPDLTLQDVGFVYIVYTCMICNTIKCKYVF
jgi:hypothetical protein